MNLSILKTVHAVWKEVGFEPWHYKNMEGVYRRVTFRKSSLLGEVARYYSDDYIIWKHDGEKDKKFVLDNWKAVEDVMTHRFLFLGDDVGSISNTRAFWFGLKGWVDIFSYKFGSEVSNRKFKDLIFVANRCLELAEKGGEG
jgi:hypothetical protein